MKTNRWRTVLLATVILLLVFISQGISAQTINGSVETIGDQKILNLWGTSYEMGYAHGYLMASEIRDLVDNVMIGYLSGGYASYYNQLIEDDTAMVTWRSEYLEEINGMIAGMVASGKNIYVPKLSRNVDARDIRAFNLILEYVSCSSLGVWGNGTTDGETVLGRNLDFFVDTKGNLTNYQMIITLEPAVGRKKVIWGVPGWVGIHSGMTEEGVSLMINFGDGGVAGGDGPFSPTMGDMRWILDNITLQTFLTAPFTMVSSVSEYFTVLIQMGSPYLGGNDPVYYVEDGLGRSKATRFAADTNPTYPFILGTNHFIKIRGFDGPRGESHQRYNHLQNGVLSLLSTGDFKVDSTEVRNLLNSVANPDLGDAGHTEMQVIIRPNRLEFDLAFGKKVNGIFTSANKVPTQTYKWADLFPNHDPKTAGRAKIADFDGDGKTDIAVYRTSTGAWYVKPSGGSAPYGIGWGGDASDKPVPGDYDGDGKTDIAVYRKNLGAWRIIPSSTGVPYGVGWGGDPNDIPVPGDYDGDGKTDIAVYRKNLGTWWITPSSTDVPYGVGWGGDPNDIPVPGDYNGDGKTDIAVYRTSTGAWYVYPSGGGSPYGIGWGGDATDKPVPGDYDGDGKTDITVYRTSTGAWYVYPSGGASPYGFGWGGDASDIPLAANPN